MYQKSFSLLFKDKIDKFEGVIYGSTSIASPVYTDDIILIGNDLEIVEQYYRKLIHMAVRVQD